MGAVYGEADFAAGVDGAGTWASADTECDHGGEGIIMAKLTAVQRNRIPASKFGLPGQRKYPIEDRSHAINAKARAAQQMKMGNLSTAQQEAIDAKANRFIKYPVK
jgi:hypothetical protein